MRKKRNKLQIYSQPNQQTKFMELPNYNKDKKLRKKNVPDLSSMMYGKVPPQAKELEEAVLGAVLLEKSAFDRVIEILQPQCFYSDANQRIFKACVQLAASNLPIDLFTVCEQLSKNEELELIGGAHYLMQITKSVVSAANLESHAKIVLEKFIKREIIRISGELIGDAYDDGGQEPFDLLDDAEKQLYSLSFKNMGKMYMDSASVAMDGITHTEKMKNRDEDITGVPTGFEIMDKATAGWQDGDLIILAARPSVGKTAFALNLATNAAEIMKSFVDSGVRADGKQNVGFFSLEMSARQLGQRIASAKSGVPLDKIMRGKLDDEEMKKATEQGWNVLANMGLFIDDSSSLTINQLRTKARKMVKNHKVGLIIIDYLQLMSGVQNWRSDNREQEISKISRDLKMLAKELQIPIIPLSQLSRDVEKRSGKKIPQLSDLRDSGAIEQDADMVMFLYRPEYYKDMVDDAGDKYGAGETHVRIAKNRSGNLETIKLKFLQWIQKFESLTKEDKEAEKKSSFVPMDKLPFPDVPKPSNATQSSLEDDYNFNQ